MSDEEEKQNNPKLNFGDLGNGQSVEVTLEMASAGTTGESKFGEWQLWFGQVEKATVHEGKGKDEKLVMDYTGKVIFFPSEKLIPKLEKAANGNEGVKVKVTKVEKKGISKKFTTYEVEKLSEGTPSDSSLTPIEVQLIDATRVVMKEYGIEMTEEIFMTSSQEPQYENKISKERAKDLYEHI